MLAKDFGSRFSSNKSDRMIVALCRLMLSSTTDLTHLN